MILRDFLKLFDGLDPEAEVFYEWEGLTITPRIGDAFTTVNNNYPYKNIPIGSVIVYCDQL